MFEILDKSGGNSVGFKASGKVSGEDYDVLFTMIDKAIDEYGEINLLVLLEDFSGWADKEAAEADFKFGTQQYKQVKRCAFVSDKKWHEWAVKILDPFTRRTEEKFFETSDLQEGWQWVRDS